MADPMDLRAKMDKLFETTIDTAQFLFDYGSEEVWTKLITAFIRSNPNRDINDEAERLERIQDKVRAMFSAVKEEPRVLRPASSRAYDSDEGPEVGTADAELGSA